MNKSELFSDMRWWNKAVFVRAAVFFSVLYVVLLFAVERAKPPESYVFEKLPPIKGIYKCCEAGGRYSSSWIGNIGISCGPISYFGFLGTNRNDCGLREKINGLSVLVEQIVIPKVGEGTPIVREIRSETQVYYYLSDESVKRLWVENSRSGAFSIAIIAFIWLYALQMILIDIKKKGEGEQS